MKKYLAIILAVMMIFTLAPSVAMAGENSANNQTENVVENTAVIEQSEDETDTLEAESDGVIVLTTKTVASGKCGAKAKWTLDNKGNLIISGKGSVDAWYFGYDRTDVKINRAKIKSLTIKSGITEIGNFSFASLKNLKSITISATVKNLLADAFQGCTKLTSVKFASNSKLKEIGPGTFYGCKSLKTITIPKSVTGISISVFEECTKLETVKFASGSKLIYLGASQGYCFKGCKNLKSITIPAKVTTIGMGNFEGCTSLASVKFASGSKLKTINASAFSGCKNLKSLTIPSGVTSIGEAAFEKCTSLKSITIPAGVKSIEEATFDKCTGLTSVKFASGSKLTGIAKKAFFGCTNLKSITIPESVKSIGSRAIGFYHDNSGYKLIPGFVIKGASGSQAETYAGKNGISFKAQ